MSIMEDATLIAVVDDIKERLNALEITQAVLGIALMILGGSILLHNQQIKTLGKQLRDARLCQLQSVQCPKEFIAPVNPEPVPPTYTLAAWYRYELAGEQYGDTHATAAMRDVPRGSHVRVTNTANGKSVTVRVNDYGPDASVFPERGVDLSLYAFGKIADPKTGVVEVSYEVL